MTQKTMLFTAGVFAASAMLTPVLSAQATQAKPGQIIQKPGVPDVLLNKLRPEQPPPVDPNYVIGPDDILTIQVYREEGLSGDVVVRPDGKISLKYTNEIVAAGLTTEQLKEKVRVELKKLMDEPTVYIQVKAILSRWVSITGAVNRQGKYPLTGPMRVIDLIALAGGLQEFAKKKEILYISPSQKSRDGGPLTYKINYADLERGRNHAKFNIELRPGDQLIVPGGI